MSGTGHIRCTSSGTGTSPGLLTESRPDLDVELLAHVLLGGLRSDVVVQLVTSGETERLAAALRTTATALLDTPADGA